MPRPAPDVRISGDLPSVFSFSRRFPVPELVVYHKDAAVAVFNHTVRPDYAAVSVNQ